MKVMALVEQPPLHNAFLLYDINTVIYNLAITHQLKIESLVEIILVVIHPHLGQTDQIFLPIVVAGVPRWRSGASSVDMADMRARYDFQTSSTHPYLDERNVQDCCLIKIPLNRKAYV